MRRNRLLYAAWLINLLRFQGARPDHVWVQSSCCCFPRELVSFDSRHVTRSSPIGNVFELGGITILNIPYWIPLNALKFKDRMSVIELFDSFFLGLLAQKYTVKWLYRFFAFLREWWTPISDALLYVSKIMCTYHGPHRHTPVPGNSGRQGS